MKKKNINELELTHKIGIDKDSHGKLRKLKRFEKKSMARIVKTLIDNKYENTIIEN